MHSTVFCHEILSLAMNTVGSSCKSTWGHTIRYQMRRNLPKFRVYRPRQNKYFGAMRAIAWSMCVLWWARGDASYDIHVFETS